MDVWFKLKVDSGRTVMPVLGEKLCRYDRIYSGYVVRCALAHRAHGMDRLQGAKH